MNTLIQDNLLAIVIFLMLIILLLMSAIAFILVKLLLSSKEVKQAPSAHSSVPELSGPAINSPKNEALKKFKKISEEIVVEKYFCDNHTETPSSGTCLICEDVFCEKCIVEHESLYFCKEHFKTFVNNKWAQITDVKTTPSTPEDGLFIYNFKKQIWTERDQPSFVLTHYKINIEHDYIESYIQLNVLESQSEALRLEIEDFKIKNKNNN